MTRKLRGKSVPETPLPSMFPESRQQRRSRERAMAKGAGVMDREAFLQLAARTWSEVTDGAGVVLVDGKPVEGGDPEALS